MKRISLIDLGSNSVRFVISELQENGSYRLIYQQKESIRLSEGMWETYTLTEEAMSRGISVMKALAHMARAMGADEMHAIATAAVRLAHNGQDFIDRVKAETNIEIKAISGEEEAYLGFLGVVNTIGLEDFILFDLGGASIELTLVEGRENKASVSLPMGALTLTEQFQHGKEMSLVEYGHLVHYVRKQLASVPWLKDKNLPLVGIGGTARNIAKMNQRAINYPVPRLHNYKLKRHTIDDMFQMIRTKSLSERKKIAGLSSERADIIVAGMALIIELIDVIGAPSMTVSGCGLREGLFFQYWQEEYGYQSPIIEDITIHSTANMLHMLDSSDIHHAQYVAWLSDMLCDQWAALIDGNPRCRTLLRVAALLHDTGKQINYYSHARHSAYMIINGNLYGLSHREQVMSAFIAAYSHGANGKFLKNSPYSKLLKEGDKELIHRLSFMLALGEALDESHEQIIKALHTDIQDEIIHVTLFTDGHPTTSMIDVAIDKLKKQCKKDFKRNLQIHWA